jgi:CubicO group peptidase (beta-lactamase class C family)
MAAVHRYGLPDVIFGGQKTPWGLGVQVAGGMSGGPGRRAFGHGGMASSRGLADPDAGLVAVLVANGLPDPIKNERRMFAFTDAVYRAFGDELAHLRLPARSVSEAFRLST